MNPLRVAVAEDEPLALRRLVGLLQGAGCEVVAELKDGPSLLAWLEGRPAVDALFLDIHMPGASGFEVLGELKGKVEVPPLVFVTAYPEHALRAFDAAALDYLLKPVSPERLEETLRRLRGGRGPQPPDLPASQASPPVLGYLVKAGEGHVVMELRRTSHFEFDEGLVWAWVQGQRFRTSWRRLSEVESAFPTHRLLRIQRHILLRPEAVLGFRPLFGGRLRVRLGDGLELDVSRTATQQLKDTLRP